MLRRFLGRLIMVPLGLLLGGMAAGGVLLTLGQEQYVRSTLDAPFGMGVFNALIHLLMGLKVILSKAWIAPLLLVVTGEVAQIRSWLYYVLGGGIALALLPLLAFATLPSDVKMPDIVWQVFATAGFAGGLVYWLVAGRRA